MRAFFVALVMFGVSCSNSDEPGFQIVGDGIPTRLTSEPGDIDRGRWTFVAREAGHCVLCHQIDGLDAEFQGNLGPDLSYVGDRLMPEQLRLRIVDYQQVRPGAVMPSYYRVERLYNVGSEYAGETVLSGQEIEDIVAFLAARKE